MLKDIKAGIKSVIGQVQKKRRVEELKRDAVHITREQLAEDLRQFGIEQGDAVFIHSSLKSLGFVEGGPASVIGALQDAVGSEGTLVLPTYYLPGGTILSTCMMKDYVFDVRHHGTNMGAMPEAFLATPGVMRSVHPTHSVSAIGKHAALLTQDHHRAPSVFGKGSPWQRFSELEKAKVLGLGISMGPVTYYHLAEDTLGDDYPIRVWVEPTYSMPCIDWNGQQCAVPVRAYKPELMERRIDNRSRADMQEWFAQEFELAGLRKTGRVGQAQSWFIPASGFLEKIIALASEGITIYSTPEELKARPPGKTP